MDVSLWPVIFTAASSFPLGGLWYSPLHSLIRGAWH